MRKPVFRSVVFSIAILIAALAALPASASFINYSAKEINVKIVYTGAAGSKTATENLQYIYEKTSPGAKGKMIRLATGGDDSTIFFDFLPLELGEIRGFKTRFHLYTVDGGASGAAARLLILKGVDGVVFVADCAPARMKANVDALVELQSDLKKLGYDFEKIPVTFQLEGANDPGAVPEETMKQMLRLGDRPVFGSEVASGVGVFDALKSIAKQILMELKKGSDAPPKSAPKKSAKTK